MGFPDAISVPFREVVRGMVLRLGMSAPKPVPPKVPWTMRFISDGN